MVVAFFLTPYILHRLGDAGFGLWMLVSSVTGYYGLLGFGTRNAIIRYVSRYHASNDHESLNRVINTGVATYTALCLLMILASVLVAWKLELLFPISPEMMPTARLLVLVLGIGTAVTFPLAIFGGVLEGLQQFTWTGVVQVFSSLLRAGSIVWALERGYGLLAIGWITVIVNLAGSIVYVAVTYRLLPTFELRRSLVDLKTLWTMASFGLVTFFIGIAQALRFNLDSIVIGMFLSLQAISLFAIASRLVLYASEVVQTMAQVFTPMSSHYDALGDRDRLRRLLITGNRYASLVMFPMAAVLLVVGQSAIRVWVGPQYSASYALLVALTIPMTFYTAQATSTKVLYGMSRHILLAKVLLAEGIANLVLSIILVRSYGVMGVALGTAIPLVVTSVFFLPLHMCRVLELPLKRYLREAHWHAMLLVIPLCLVLWWADRWIQPEGYPGLIAVLLAGGVVYGAEILAYFYLVERPAQMRSVTVAE